MSKYTYHNVNPLGEHEQDCVIRAISLGTSTPYERVIELLENTGDYKSCEELCVCCYSHLLDEYFRFKKERCKGLTVSEFAIIHPYGIFLIRMSGHLSCLINGVVHDIWNCNDEILTDAWRVDS